MLSPNGATRAIGHRQTPYKAKRPTFQGGATPALWLCAGGAQAKQSRNLTPIMSALHLLGRNGQRAFLQEDCFDKVSSISDNAHRFDAH